MTKRPTAKPEQSAIQPVTFSPYFIRRHHAQLSEWAQANGLDPADIPHTHPIRVEEGDDGPVIRFHVVVRDGSGEVQSDSVEAGDLVTTERTVPCAVPPPDLDTPAVRHGTEAGE
jgi:hypothetical protein